MVGLLPVAVHGVLFVECSVGIVCPIEAVRCLDFHHGEGAVAMKGLVLFTGDSQATKEKKENQSRGRARWWTKDRVRDAGPAGFVVLVVVVVVVVIVGYRSWLALFV